MTTLKDWWRWMVERGAVPQSEARLTRAAMRSPSPRTRQDAVEAVSHQKALAWLAGSALDKEVRRIACAKVASPDLLFERICRDADVAVRWVALDRLRKILGEEALASMVGKWGGRIRDVSLLASLVFEIATLDADERPGAKEKEGNARRLPRRSSPALERAALAWLKDPALLAYLARHHGDPEIREAARRAYPSTRIPIGRLSEEVFPYGCPTCQYVSSDPISLCVPGLTESGFHWARVTCPRCHRDFDVSPASDGRGSDWTQNLSNGPLGWEIRDCPQCGGRNTMYRIEFPRTDQRDCRRCGWGETVDH